MANEYYNANPSTDADNAYGLSARAYSAEYLSGLYVQKTAWKKLLNKTADAGFGESVNLAIFPTLAAVDVTAATGAYTAIDTSITQGSIVMDKQKAVPFRLTAPLIAQSKVDVMAAFAEQGGKALADSIDAELVELFASLTENSAGSLGAALTDAYIQAAMAELVKDNISFTNSNDFVWVLPGTQYGSVIGLKSYTNYSINAGSSLADGGADLRAHVDTLYGIDVVFRNDASMAVTGGVYGALLSKDSIGVAISKQFAMEPPQRITGTTAYEMLVHGIFGINIMDATRACLIKTV